MDTASGNINLKPVIRLNAGNLSCQYHDGRLYEIKSGEIVIAKTLYPALRDVNWDTAIPKIIDEDIQQKEDSFYVTFRLSYQHDSILYKAECLIRGEAGNTIHFEIKGLALSDFESNRIGLCLHLPVQECAGVKVIVTHSNGKGTDNYFPTTINPNQPITSIHKLRWKINGNCSVCATFTGDDFEMEDQRNWMDYSFKIYNRPLYLPYPYKVKKGDAIEQSISLETSMQSERNQTTEIQSLPLASIPLIGIAAAEETAYLTTQEIDLLRQLPLHHYRVELYFENDWRDLWKIHCTNANALNTSLELILFFTDNYISETNDFLSLIDTSECRISSILPLHKNHKVTPTFLQEFVYQEIKEKFPHIPVGYGTDSYFAELNRQRPESNLYDFISFSLNPQVHSFDSQTVLENIFTLPYIFSTINTFTDKPVFLSPVTLRKRKNHDGKVASRHQFINDGDERLHSDFGANWLLLFLSYATDAHQITFFKTTGNSGIVNKSANPSPVYNLLRELRNHEAIFIVLKALNDNKTFQIILKNVSGNSLTFLINKT